MGPEDLLRVVVLACEKLSLRYLVTGSTATIAYGEPRFTNDIDVVLELSADQIDHFCRQFPEVDFYLSRPAVVSAVQSHGRYFKEGGSQKHVRDIRGVLEIRGNRIDRQYIADWARKLDVFDEWTAAQHWN